MDSGSSRRALGSVGWDGPGPALGRPRHVFERAGKELFDAVSIPVLTDYGRKAGIWVVRRWLNGRVRRGCRRWPV